MNILWVEDFGGNLLRHNIVLELFSRLIPEIRTEFDPDNYDVSSQLASIFERHTLHSIYLCQSYSEWKEIYKQHNGCFDIALIDINLSAYKTPIAEIPEGINDCDFDRIAGFYIFHQLVKHGFPDDNIAFFTGEGLSLREFHSRCAEILLDKPKYTFEKNPRDLKALSEWILQKLTGTKTEPRFYIGQKNDVSRKIFISYAKEDIDRAYSIYATLKQIGYNPWIDEENLVPGQEWTLEIERAIEESTLFIACLSSNSVTKEGYFQKELKKAVDILDRKPEGLIYLIPVRFDNCVVPSRFQKIHYCDLFRTNGTEKLLKAIKSRFDTKTPYNPDAI